eukprot:TRINITY_DN4309_c0_g1_i3.p1 TRINITY_DN4309_c0_g1~~TRINITY_DN4309_c0_g1_i3.p1  ORF type:complete len:454 (-),score=68.85 TRINITY_DN4309_c0_g1_i3:194-1555(-)
MEGEDVNEGCSRCGVPCVCNTVRRRNRNTRIILDDTESEKENDEMDIVDASPTPNFVQRITIDEYNRQSIEYTQLQLSLLLNHLRNQTVNNNNFSLLRGAQNQVPTTIISNLQHKMSQGVHSAKQFLLDMFTLISLPSVIGLILDTFTALFFCFSILVLKRYLFDYYTNVVSEGIGFWSRHGILYLFGATFFPKMVLLYCIITLRPWYFWAMWSICPQILVALLAYQRYWETDPVLVLAAVCYGGFISGAQIYRTAKVIPLSFALFFSRLSTLFSSNPENSNESENNTQNNATHNNRSISFLPAHVRRYFSALIMYTGPISLFAPLQWDVSALVATLLIEALGENSHLNVNADFFLLALVILWALKKDNYTIEEVAWGIVQGIGLKLGIAFLGSDFSAYTVQIGTKLVNAASLGSISYGLSAYYHRRIKRKLAQKRRQLDRTHVLQVRFEIET